MRMTGALGFASCSHDLERNLNERRANSCGERTMAARKKTSKKKYGKAASKRVESAMRRRKKGTLKSGKGGKGGR